MTFFRIENEGRSGSDSVMVSVHSPGDEVELRLICSILESEGIPHFVHNDNFGTLRIGPRIDLFNAKSILVPRTDADRARELIADYTRATRAERTTSRFDKLRMILEMTFFGWFIPGRKRRG